jgi:hypothetical protein
MADLAAVQRCDDAASTPRLVKLGVMPVCRARIARDAITFGREESLAKAGAAHPDDADLDGAITGWVRYLLIDGEDENVCRSR